MKNTFNFISHSKNKISTANCFVRESTKETMKLKTALIGIRVILMCKGTATFYIDNKAYDVKCGDLVFGFKDEQFYAIADDDCEYMYIDFDGENAYEIFTKLNISPDNRIFSNHQKLIPFWNNAMAKIGNIELSLVIESTLLYSFSKFNQGNTDNNSIFYKIHEIIEQRFNDPDLSMNTVSKELCYNRKYLSYYYKKEFGIGFMEHLTHTKIQFAIALFKHGIKTVKHASYLAGYNDPYYFSTIFKEKMGITPTEYIERIENNKNE